MGGNPRPPGPGPSRIGTVSAGGGGSSLPGSTPAVPRSTPASRVPLPRSLIRASAVAGVRRYSTRPAPLDAKDAIVGARFLPARPRAGPCPRTGREVLGAVEGLRSPAESKG